MPQYLRLPSGSARMAVGYITTGILMIVWTGVWMHYLYNHESESQGYWYVSSGLMLSGFALLIIGILMGRIGQEAKNADGVAAMPTAAETLVRPSPSRSPPKPAGAANVHSTGRAPAAADGDGVAAPAGRRPLNSAPGRTRRGCHRSRGAPFAREHFGATPSSRRVRTTIRRSSPTRF